MTIKPSRHVPVCNFALSLMIGAYRFGVFLVGNLALRYAPTRYAVKAMKELRLDTRQAWELERLHFLNRDMSPGAKLFLLRLYDALTPVGFGLAWGCAMEAAYRIFNLAWFQHGNPDLTPRQQELVERSFGRNCAFIQGNLETGSFNNHYAFNVFGLVIAAARDPSIDEAYWISEFVRILRTQFGRDGTNFEASTAYHGLMLEALARLVRLRPELGELVLQHVNMAGCIRFAEHGEAPALLIGDNDGSVVIKDRSGPAALARAAFKVPQTDLEGVTGFPDFKAVFFRERGVEVSLWNPQIGQGGKGGHNHNDSLSLLLSVDGQAVIGDPGVPFYAFARNPFRRVNAHATPFPDGFEPYDLADRFRVINRGTRYLSVSGNAAEAGYSDAGRSVEFQRSIGWHADSDIRIDVLDRSNNPAFCPILRLALPPGVSFARYGQGVELLHPSIGRTIVIETGPESIRWESRLALFAPNYGKLGVGHVITARPMLEKFAWSIQIQ
jgi:hypothetical protein